MTRIGRFTLLEELGAGGMGVVWAAYDPELDRRIALKLVRGEHARLMREAQALARVSHPNVVAVHDVGSEGEQIYIAQELVRGGDLDAWLAAAPRSVDDIRDVFVQAARGLAAAHAAGLVHRDFKPSNVLVGDDGRVRIVDFGLARAEGTPPGDSASASPSVLASPLTQTGTVMGTPLYMAPEQHDGQPADARSDQFSFCVTLAKALYGELPFRGETAVDYSVEAMHGNVLPAPKGSRVPAWLREVVLRGLRPDPAQRYPAMLDVVEALEHDPRRVRRRWLVLAAAAGGVALTVLALARGGDDAAVCTGGRARVAAIWNPAVSAGIRAAFARTGRPFAEPTWRRVEPQLASYLAAWTAMRTDACEATTLRGEQSAELMDLRMSCLDRRLADATAALDLLAHADAQVVERADAIVGALPPLADCADVAALGAGARPPRDPVARARIASVERAIADASARCSAGDYRGGITGARAALASARSIGYGPLLADALVLVGRILMTLRADAEAEAMLREGFLEAQAAKADATAISAANLLITHVGTNLLRTDEALWWGQLSRALARREGKPRLDVDGAYAVGELLVEAGRYREGMAEIDRALAAVGPGDGRIPQLRTARASALFDQQRFDESLAEFRRVLASREATVGPDHPDTGRTLGNVGSVLDVMGRHDEALVAYRRATEIAARALGENHPEVATGYNNIGSVLTTLGKFDEAEAMLRRALAITDRFGAAGANPDSAQTHGNLGVLYQAQGKQAEALAETRIAADIMTRARGPDHPDLAPIRENVGILLEAQGKRAEALVELRAALAIEEKAFGPDGPQLVGTLEAIAEVLRKTGDGPGAAAATRRADAIKANQPGAQSGSGKQHD
jgi:eukaryotic-like serine/threonine-protein kinase